MTDKQMRFAFSAFLVGMAAVLPLCMFLYMSPGPWSEDFPLALGLVLQAYIGFSAFALVQSYEMVHSNRITFGYVIFWSALGICYLAGKSVLLPVSLEIASFSTIIIYSGTEFGKKQIESLGSLLFASGIAVLFLSAWVFLPEEDPRGYYFLTIGLLVKSGFSGFHIWLPKVNEGGPSHALGSFAGALEIFPLLLFCRYVLPNLQDPFLYSILFPLAALGVFFGGITSYFHKDPKKALAYSSIESINFLWLCLAISGMFQSSSEPDLRFLSHSFLILFYLSLLHHSFSKTFQLFSIGMVARLRNSSSTDEMKGIGRLIGINPLWMGLGTFSYAVLPGTLGFISEATYLFLNAKILDMPLGRSVFLLPAMIFIFFGIVLGGFTHIRLFLSLFLSFPRTDFSLTEWNDTRRFWVFLSLGSLGIMIIGIPLCLPFFLKIPFLQKHLDPSLAIWLSQLSIVSCITVAFILSLVWFRWSHRITKRQYWDCGNQYIGPELSVPSTVFTEPLRNSLGRYFLTPKGLSIIDQSIFSIFSYILNIGQFLVEKKKNHDEEVSKYLAISSAFLIIILAISIAIEWSHL
ncbi:formate hydrogenase subunit B [Leptospira ryugenii]|uniref:Formate hydrogenase subunit B n=1 Tax=Leptospira ryugenii TaxID=1917863 RepID=A0A2P2DZ14_9LEPT|nr:proton-conducting transporter membrane subunit [Leptospira ryugenii]GBF49872.1 formate hydrogenase subunit B [Leptospira ryugenii]